MSELFSALSNFSWMTFVVVFVGIGIGMVTGVLPGIGASVAIALLLPFLIGMDPTLAIVLCACIYCSDAYGGAITSILINAPGGPSSAVTTFDGYPMAKRGEAGYALGVAAVASAIGGLCSTVLLMIAAPALGKVAYFFGPPEYLALTIFGLTMIVSLGGKSPLKGIIGGMIGVFLATVGIDFSTGIERFTFGVPELSEGIKFAPLMIGLFAGSELLMQAGELRSENVTILRSNLARPTMRQLRKVMPTIGVSSGIGAFIGILPAAGATVASFIAYNEAKRMSRHPERFGTGVIEGVAAPESANNAAAAASLIPTLTLSIPGSGVGALILGAMIMVGLQPGPQLFTEQSDFLWTLFAGLMLVNLSFIPMGFYCSSFFARISLIPAHYLWPMIFLLCIIGSYSVGSSWVDVWVMVAFSLIGYVLRQRNYSLAPIVMGLVLGKLFEDSLMQTSLMFEGDFALLVQRPIAVVFLAIAALSLFFSLRKFVKKQPVQESVS